MISWTRVVALGCVLLWGMLACAPRPGTPRLPSAQGYVIRVERIPDPLTFNPTPSTDPDTYLNFGEVRVQVHDVQGHPIDGVLVEFALDPSWEGHAELTPKQAYTHQGHTKAVFIPKTTGPAPIRVQVDNVTRKVSFMVQGIPFHTTPHDLPGLPYPPPR